MPTIHFHQTTSLTPEQYVAGLTDFGPGRSKLFGNSADEYLKVHQRGRTQADVTEGSGGIWERLHYDWSDPNTSSSRRPTPTRGEAPPATLTPSRVVPMAPPTLTWPSYARARISRDSCSASCSVPSAGAFWKRRLQTASRPSKPETAWPRTDTQLKNAASKPTPTGRIGTPSIWCASRPAENCRNNGMSDWGGMRVICRPALFKRA